MTTEKAERIFVNASDTKMFYILCPVVVNLGLQVITPLVTHIHAFIERISDMQKSKKSVERKNYHTQKGEPLLLFGVVLYCTVYTFPYTK